MKSLVAALLAIALVLACVPLASAATTRQAERAVAAKLRKQMHKRADVRCQRNKGWFGCHWSVTNRRNWTVGNAVVAFRRGHRSPTVRFFGVQCVGKPGRCPQG